MKSSTLTLTTPTVFPATFVRGYETYNGAHSMVDSRSPDMRKNPATLYKTHAPYMIPNRTDGFAFQLHNYRDHYVVSVTKRGDKGRTIVGHIYTNSFTPIGNVEFIGTGLQSLDDKFYPQESTTFSGTVSNATTVLDILQVFKAKFLQATKYKTVTKFPKRRKSKATANLLNQFTHTASEQQQPEPATTAPESETVTREEFNELKAMIVGIAKVIDTAFAA